MSKRQLSTSPSTPRKRKGLNKASSNQPSLDSFFKARSTATSPQAVPSGDIGRSGPSSATSPSASDVFQDLAADEALARRLAEEDGIDIHMLRRMETTITSKAVAGPSSPVAKTPPDVIDVDLLEYSEQDETVASGQGKETAMPSTSQPTVSDESVSSNTGARHCTTTGRALVTAEAIETAATYPSLDVDPVPYSLDECPWRSKSAPYSFLAHGLATLSSTKSRIAIMNVLTNTLRTIIMFDPASLRSALYLLSNTLAPPYSPIELGLGPSIMSKAIQDVSGLTAAALRRLYNSTGDPGELSVLTASIWGS